jgi:hypothetical protein
MASKDIVGDKKNRANPGSPQVFYDPVQNGLTQQVKHGRGRAEKRRHRLREVFPCRRLACLIADTST